MPGPNTSGRNFFSALVLFSIFQLQSIAVFAAPEPSVSASGLTATLQNCNEIDLSWTNGDGSRRMVVASANVPVSGFPVDGLNYIAGSIFGSGSNLGNNNFVVYNSTGNSVTISGLNASKYYYFAVFEYNGSGSGVNYLISLYPETDTIPFGLVLTLTASDTTLCNGSSVTLEAGGAQTYSWSPATGLSSTSGDVVTASPSATTRYSVLATDSLGCQAIERVTLTVFAKPTVTLGSFSSMCQDDSPRTLTGGSPSGGVYSGNGVSGNQFDPLSAGPGVHQITYTYTNAQGCSNSANSSITVHARPAVSIGAFNNRCENGGILNLVSGSPSGGTYSGTGVSGNTFNPELAGAGTYAITYTYTDNNGCTNSASSNITVLAVPVVTLSVQQNICIDASPIVLNGGSPFGGTYSGPGVQFGMFNPANAGVGAHTISYRFTSAQGCSDSAFANIEVRDLPAVTFAARNPVCLNTTAFTMSGGSPSGGAYSGNGVSSNMFNASTAGTGLHLLTYTYTDVYGCVNSDTASQRVYALPVVNFAPLSPVCANTGPVVLSGGSPSGGTYSGTGVGGGVFFSGIAGAGTHPIIYSYTDINGCTGSAAQNMIVNTVPVVNLGPDTTVCSDAEILLDAGAGFSSYSWSTGQNTQLVTLDTTGRGTGTFNIRVTVTNSFGCVGRDTVFVTFDICTAVGGPLSTYNDLKIYPNPFSNGFNVVTQRQGELQILDLQGKLYEKIYIDGSIINAGYNLASGVYLIRFIDDKGIGSKLVIKE